nr:unnamed protein product [Callosobruchus chinensis]
MTTLVNLIIDLEKDEKHSIRMPNRKTKFVTCIDISVVIFIVVFGIATLPIKIKKIWRTMNCLNETDKILQLKNSKRFRRSSIHFLVFVFILTVIIFSYDISSWFVVLQQQSKSPVEYLRAYFCFYCLYVVMLAKELLYWHVIFFVKIKISTLNARLRELKKASSYNEHPKIVIDRSDLDRWSLNKGIRKVNSVSSESVCTSGICLSLDQEITSLTRYQDHIFQAVEVINSTTEYGIHIFAKGKLIFIILQTTWVLGHLGRVLIIVEPCQLCINEHRKTANLICDLLTNELKDHVEKAVSTITKEQTLSRKHF